MSVLDFEGLYCNLNYNQFNCRKNRQKKSLRQCPVGAKASFFTGQVFEAPPENAYIYIDPKIANVQQFFSNFFEKIFAWENTQLILGIE